MNELVPQAVIISCEDGVVMISACFEIPPDASPQQLLFAAARTVNDSIHLQLCGAYPMEVVDANTIVFKKVQ